MYIMTTDGSRYFSTYIKRVYVQWHRDNRSPRQIAQAPMWYRSDKWISLSIKGVDKRDIERTSIFQRDEETHVL